MVPYRPRKPIRSSATRRTMRAFGVPLCSNSHPDCLVSAMSGGSLPAGASEDHSCRVFYAGKRIVFARPPHYGAVFTDREARDLFLLEQGYLVPYSRNCVEFVSSRAYRRHTGRPSVLTDAQWNRRYRRDPRE